jgi:hypothetical protein
MKTSVIMSRELFGMSVAQNSKTEFFSSTDLVKAGNKWRVINGHSLFNEKAWFKNKGTEEFINELEGKFGKVKIPARGRGNHTWIHPLLFIDMALAISPTLKIEVYEWMFDNLIKYRNEGGDSYKKMCGALFVRSTTKANFPLYISDVAKKIKLACGVQDWNQATEQQLTTRKKLHNDIALLSDVLNDNDQAVRIAVLKLD